MINTLLFCNNAFEDCMKISGMQQKLSKKIIVIKIKNKKNKKPEHGHAFVVSRIPFVSECLISFSSLKRYKWEGFKF